MVLFSTRTSMSHSTKVFPLITSVSSPSLWHTWLFVSASARICLMCVLVAMVLPCSTNHAPLASPTNVTLWQRSTHMSPHTLLSCSTTSLSPFSLMHFTKWIACMSTPSTWTSEVALDTWSPPSTLTVVSVLFGSENVTVMWSANASSPDHHCHPVCWLALFMLSCSSTRSFVFVV